MKATEMFKLLNSDLATELVKLNIGFNENIQVKMMIDSIQIGVKPLDGDDEYLSERANITVNRIGKPDCYMYAQNQNYDLSCKYSKIALEHLSVVMKNIQVLSELFVSHHYDYMLIRNSAKV